MPCTSLKEGIERLGPVTCHVGERAKWLDRLRTSSLHCVEFVELSNNSGHGHNINRGLTIVYTNIFELPVNDAGVVVSTLFTLWENWQWETIKLRPAVMQKTTHSWGHAIKKQEHHPDRVWSRTSYLGEGIASTSLRRLQYTGADDPGCTIDIFL